MRLKRKSNKAVGEKSDDSLNVVKNFVNCHAVDIFYLFIIKQ